MVAAVAGFEASLGEFAAEVEGAVDVREGRGVVVAVMVGVEFLTETPAAGPSCFLEVGAWGRGENAVSVGGAQLSERVA